MSKLPASETTAPELIISVRAVVTINNGSKLHAPGSVFEVTQKDADMLMKAGAVILATDLPHVPIEEVLPIGMDDKVWRADPRQRVNGQRPTSFVKCADFDAEYPRADQH